MTSAFIIRFHYNANDHRFKWRFDYFKNKVLPTILYQTNQDFDIAIRCNSKHNDLFKSLNKKINPFQVRDEKTGYKISFGKKYFVDFVEWKDVINLPQYDLQMGLDSDDFIGKNYVQTIKNSITNIKESLHLSFQPSIFDLKTRKFREMRTRYGPTNGSAFMALYQPNKINYKFIYCDSHLKMWKYAKKSITLPNGHCWITIHDYNESTGK